MNNFASSSTKGAYAFLFGCDIDGWTKGTTNEEQGSWAQNVQDLVKSGMEYVFNIYNLTERNCDSIVVSTGDGAYVAFIDSKFVDAPLYLAKYMTENAQKLPCTLGLALNSGIVSLVTDASGRINLSGDGISDLSRILQSASTWQIAISSNYAETIGNLRHETRKLLTSSPVVREDKHGKKHYIKFINGEFEGVLLGIPRMSLGETKPRNDESPNDMSIEKLHSWLPNERKINIIEQYNVYINGGLLRNARNDHYKALKKIAKSAPESPFMPAWTSISTTDSAFGYRLTMGFQNVGCSYRREDPLRLGCFHCGFYAGSKAPSQLLQKGLLRTQFFNALKFGFERGIRYDVIEFLSDGSFLDEKEVPHDIRLNIFSAIKNMANVRRVLIESTPEKIIKNIECVVELARKLRDDQELEIGIGLETSDDFIRHACLNKGTKRSIFEEALDKIASTAHDIQKKIRPVAYIFVKSPWLSDIESIDDCVRTIDYINEISKIKGIDIIPKLEPAIISEGTLLSLLWKKGEYSPLNIWAIVEILCKIKSHPTCSQQLEKIRIGTRSDMDESVKLPGIYEQLGRFNQYDFIIYRGIQQFNQHHDLNVFFGLLQAVYSAKKTNISGQNQSLKAWEKSAFGGSSDSCNIIKYLNDPITSKDIISASTRESVIRTASHSIKLFDFLDIIEGQKLSENNFINMTNIWWGTVKNATNFNQIKETKNEVQLKLNEILRTLLYYTEVRVIDLSAEIDPNNDEIKFLRIGMEIVDFIRRESYEIWATSPTEAIYTSSLKD